MNIFNWHRKPSELTLKVTVVVEPDDTGFHAFCPGLQGVHVGGETEDEIIENIRDAIMLHLESLAAHGDPLPVGPDCVVEETERFQIPAGAFLRHLELQWPSHQTSGAR